MVSESRRSRLFHAAAAVAVAAILACDDHTPVSPAAAPVTVEPTPTTPVVTFVRTGSMTTARVRHTATLLANGKVLIAGGGMETAELYDPTTGTFALTGSMSARRAGHSATLLADGKVLIAGGYISDSGDVATNPDLLASAELYDPATGSFSRTGNMLEAQSGQIGTLLANGKVLFTGGVSSIAGCCGVPPTPALYDPATGVFSATGNYVPNSLLSGDLQNWGLTMSTAALLRDGSVLIAAEPIAQRYDPLTGSFALTGQMSTARFGLVPVYLYGRTATLLKDGRVFLTGGEHEDLGRFANTELYDPSTGTFAAGASMAIVRDGHTATLLANGKVLVVGGESENGCSAPSTCEIASSASGELFDPVTGTLGSAGNMTERRELHQATLLNDGTVLITGGTTFVGGPVHFNTGFSVVALSSAELYVGAKSASADRSTSVVSRPHAP